VWNLTALKKKILTEWRKEEYVENEGGKKWREIMKMCPWGLLLPSD
jgi:hypothetical protein